MVRIRRYTSFCHEAFVKACKDTPHNWMITYNEHPWLREQFVDFHMENFEFRYSLGHRKENKNKKEELLVMNYKRRLHPEEIPKNNVIENLLSV